MSREVVAQQGPTVSLQNFPCRELTPKSDLWRAHTRSFGPWWFGNDGSGRFDLAAPRGTCYLADAPVVAVRERLGIVLGSRPVVAASLLEDVVVSRLHLPDARRCADIESDGAGAFGVTRELASMVPYDVPRSWARGFDEVGFGGVAYGPRFSPGEATSFAVFGEAGEADWPTDPDPVAAVDVEGVPVSVDPPRKWDLTVVKPPRTRTRV